MCYSGFPMLAPCYNMEGRKAELAATSDERMRSACVVVASLCWHRVTTWKAEKLSWQPPVIKG
jgi:hypothetical protein